VLCDVIQSGLYVSDYPKDFLRACYATVRGKPVWLVAHTRQKEDQHKAELLQVQLRKDTREDPKKLKLTRKLRILVKSLEKQLRL